MLVDGGPGRRDGAAPAVPARAPDRSAGRELACPPMVRGRREALHPRMGEKRLPSSGDREGPLSPIPGPTARRSPKWGT
ncbi:hypothetical protein GCM10010344_35170 [Streptomyces bluensis]|nr:hypothetical protein GCM10010344_35170 [Streptomyces bluensis]